MSTYHATLDWHRGSDEFLRQRYSRGHRWSFDEGLTVPASASPHAVREPWHVARAVDPEEAVTAALASCHMLFFLASASRAGFTVESYTDAPESLMEKNEQGRESLTQFTLRPLVVFKERAPSEEEFVAMHAQAHEQCYIANSIRGHVTLQPTMQVV